MEAAHLADSWKMGWKMFAYTWHWRAMSNRVFGQTRGTGERFQTECLDRHVAPESDVNPSVWTDTWHRRAMSIRVFGQTRGTGERCQTECLENVCVCWTELATATVVLHVTVIQAHHFM